MKTQCLAVMEVLCCEVLPSQTLHTTHLHYIETSFCFSVKGRKITRNTSTYIIRMGIELLSNPQSHHKWPLTVKPPNTFALFSSVKLLISVTV